MQALGYYLFIGLCKFMGLFPIRVSYILSDIIFITVYHIIGYRRKVVLQNLRNSFPEKSEKEIICIEKKFFKHLCDLIVEDIILHSISKEEYMKRSYYVNPEVLTNYLAQGRSVVVLYGHFGNWEYSSSIGLFTDYVGYPVYKKLSNPYFDSYLNKLRARFGSVPIEMHDILRFMIKSHASKKIIFTGLIADQSPMPDEANYWTKFLNQDTGMFVGGERIARKLDLPVLYLHAHKVKRGYYKWEVFEICAEPKATKEFEITEKYARTLEKLIQDKPEFWLWSHRRWKHKKPENIEISTQS
jgi:Kdo2-lipid IVA lauroyltransferase/acyltransferase